MPSEAARPAGGASSRAKKKPAEVFFDIPPPEGHISSVTDPANSDHKKSNSKPAPEPARAPPPPKKAPEPDLDVPDNNGLSRGQNFMKVEKWLREANKSSQSKIAPGEIANLEDHPPSTTRDADVPSEKDRLPHALQGARR